MCFEEVRSATRPVMTQPKAQAHMGEIELLNGLHVLLPVLFCSFLI
jgi:hypothetical protein